MAGRRVTRPAPIARHVKMHSWPLELLKKSSRVSCKPQPTLITSQTHYCRQAAVTTSYSMFMSCVG